MNSLRYTLDELMGTMQRLGIEHGLLLSPPMQGASILPNDEIIRLCRRSGGQLATLITVEPTAREVGAAIKLALENQKAVRAVNGKLSYVDAPKDSPDFCGYC